MTDQPAPPPASLPSDLLGPVKPASLRESNAILERALAECGEANAAYVASNDALTTRAEAAEARLAAAEAWMQDAIFYLDNRHNVDYDRMQDQWQALEIRLRALAADDAARPDAPAVEE